MKKQITVIDLGSSRIAAVSADIDKSGRPHLSALENLKSRGIEGGEITDINKAVQDISSVMKKLKLKEKKRLKKVYVTTGGADIRLDISRGMIPLSRVSREITKNDIRKCLELAGLVRLPVDRAVVQKIVRGFSIDGGSVGVRNPLGLYGIKLEIESFIATANRSKIQSITKCIDHAGFLLDGVYLSSIASARSVLDAKEKADGVLLLDIGGALTEALIFKNDMLQNRYLIEKGALARERPGAILKKILSALPVKERDFSSVVLTGGGALLDGVIEKAEGVFRVPSRIGLVKNVSRKLSSEDSIIHASTIGLIEHIADEYRASHIPGNPFRKLFRNLLNIYETYF